MPERRERIVEETAEQLADLHAQEYRRRSAVQRTLEHTKAHIARPWFPIILVSAFLAWVAAHVYFAIAGRYSSTLDGNWLQIALAFGAFIMTAAILSGQREDESLEEQRQELTLHLISIIDRKLSAVLDSLHRGDSNLSKPVDVEHALDVLDDAHRQSAGQGVRPERS
jgi:hypothetical protein